MQGVKILFLLFALTHSIEFCSLTSQSYYPCISPGSPTLTTENQITGGQWVTCTSYREVQTSGGTEPVFDCSPGPYCEEICNTSPCNGDSEYCTNHTCDSTALCACTTQYITTKRYCVTPQNSMYLLNVTRTAPLYLEYGDNRTAIDSVRIGRRLLSIDSFSISGPDGCHGTYQDPILTVVCDLDALLKIVKDDWSIFVQTTNRVVLVPVPYNATLNAGAISIYSVNNGGVNLEDQVQIQGVSLGDQPLIVSNCPSSDCLFCQATIDNFKCQSSTIKFSIVVFMMVAVALLLATFWWLFYCLVIVFNIFSFLITVLFKFFKYGRMSYISGREAFRRKWKKDVEDTDSIPMEEKHQKVELLVDEEVSDEELREKLPNTIKNVDLDKQPSKTLVKKYGDPSMAYSTVRALMISWLMTRADSQFQCMGGATISSPTQTCLRDLYTVNCSYTLDTLLTLPFSHTSACLSFADDNGNPQGQLNISFVEQIQYSTLTTLYYTSDWAGYISSEKSCYTPSNWCGGRCNSMAANDYNAGGHLHDSNVINYPGITGCDRPCGCAGCGCFYCSSACLPWRWSVHGSANYETVQQVAVQSYKALVEISGAYNYTGFLQSGVQITNSNFSLSLIGVFPPPLTTLSGKYLISRPSGSTYIADACPLNQPCANLPGDIQSGSINNLTLANPQAFIFYNQLAILNHGDNSVTSTFLVPGYRSSPRTALPAFFNGRYWYMQNGQLMFNETSSNSIVFNFKSVIPINISRTIDRVCPVFTIFNASGCYNCTQGMTLSLEAKSICLPGISLVQVNDSRITVSTSTIQLSQSTFTYNIKMLSSLAYQCLNVTLHSNGGDKSNVICFQLVSSNNINNNTLGDTVGSSSSNEDTWWDSFSNFFTDVLFGNWWSGLLSTIFIVVLAIFIAWAMYKTFMFIMAKRSSKPKKL